MKTTKPHIILAEDLESDTSHDSRSKAVKGHVVALAARLHAGVDLTHVEDLALYPVASKNYEPFIQRFVRGQTVRLKRLARSNQIKMHALYLQGNVVQRLLELSHEKNNYGLLALGTHGRKGVARWLLGSVAEEVIRNSATPVLVVGPEAQKHPSKISKAGEITILVATDLGQNSDGAEQFALTLAKQINARVLLFNSLHETFHPVLQTAFSSPRGSAELKDLFESLKSDASKQLEKRKLMFSKNGIHVATHLDIQTRDAGQAVLKIARTLRPALIVMGTHGRNLITQAFLGSSVREVILGARVPVITVHSIPKLEQQNVSRTIPYSICEREIMSDLVENKQIAR